MMRNVDMIIKTDIYKGCDEHKLVAGKLYLVHDDSTGLFLGSYVGRSFSPSLVFHGCQFYNCNGDIVLDQSDNTEIHVPLTTSIVWSASK